MARYFDRSSSEYTSAVMAQTLDALDEWTIAFWFRLRSAPSGNDYILSFPETSSGSNGLDFYMTSTDDLVFDISHHTGGVDTTTVNSAVSLNTWHFVMANGADTGSDNLGLLYYDGGFVGWDDTASGGITHAVGTIELARFGTFGSYADVEFAEIAVWNTDVANGETDVIAQDMLYDNKLSPLFLAPESMILYMPCVEDLASLPAWVGALSSYTSTGGAYADHPPGITYPFGPIVLTTTAPGVGGTTYDVTAAETFSFVDVDSEIGTFPRTAADAFVFADAPSETAAFVRALAETLSITDEATGSTAILATILESLAFTDSSAETATFAAQVLETLGLADASIETAALIRAVVESLVLTDASSAVGGEQQEPESAGGGGSMTLRQMRRLERQQLLEMIRKDDDVVLSLIAGILRNGNKRN